MSENKNMPEIDGNSRIEEVDAAIADALVPHAQRGFVKAIGTVSDLSDQEPLYAAAAAMLVTGALMRDGRTWRSGSRILAAHLLATAMRGVVKRLVDRTRPDAAVRRGEYVRRAGQRRDSDDSSFPSGHTAGALAVALALGRDYPRSRGVSLGIAGVAGLAQVVRSKHYVTDVVAGAAIGLAAEALIDELLRRAARV